DKTGPLNNPADRDHCIQYMTAVPRSKGPLAAEDTEVEAPADPRIAALRQRRQGIENPPTSPDNPAPTNRPIANAVQVFFEGGTSSDRVEIEYPIGHRRRRKDAVPLLWEKFKRALSTRFDAKRSAPIVKLFEDSAKLDAAGVDELMALLVE